MIYLIKAKYFEDMFFSIDRAKRKSVHVVRLTYFLCHIKRIYLFSLQVSLNCALSCIFWNIRLGSVSKQNGPH